MHHAECAVNSWRDSIRRTEWPRILFVEQDYLVIPEILSALKRLGVEHVTVRFRQDTDFLRELFDAIETFRPAFILTINHAGLDAQGEVLRLLQQTGVPLASWFVDRHEMFVRNRVTADSLLAVFSWDPDAVPSLAAQGVAHAGYLPLAADLDSFRFPKRIIEPVRDVAFVGSSWTDKTEDAMRAGQFPAGLTERLEHLARAWVANPAEPVFRVLRADSDAYDCWRALAEERRLLFLRLVQLRASGLHRVACVRELLPFSPLVVGDAHWKDALADSGSFSWRGRLDYRNELPGFYGENAVNFNANSLQSRHAQNQRVFDVPCCGAFVLSRQSAALEELFEPGTEIACYGGREDIRPAVERWQADPDTRARVVRAAYGRIMAQHTYMHRISEIVAVMERTF